MHTDVIVLGGGISGLATALQCVSAGFRTVVIEKSQRFGGRVHTVFSKHWKYEAGAGRIGKHHVRTLALLQNFGMTLDKLPGDKKYRDIRTGTSCPKKNPVYYLIEKVLKESRAINRNELQQLTFGMLCSRILGPDFAMRLTSAFGYDAEFEHMNAWDGLEMFRRDYTSKNTYFSCREGLGEWIYRIVSYLESSNMVSLLLGCTAYKWQRSEHGILTVSVYGPDGVSHDMSCKALVCAIPKNDLLESFEWSSYQKHLLDSVQEVPLNRIYAKFPAPNHHSWFSKMPVTTTNADIRQFIPVSSKHGLAMISYSDDENARMWNNVASVGERELRSTLLNQLHVVFPEVSSVPRPSWVRSHFWKDGVHMWKPGYDSQEVSEELLQPHGLNVPFYIVGESYSNHQGWIEGALETVDKVFVRMHTFLMSKWYANFV